MATPWGGSTTTPTKPNSDWSQGQGPNTNPYSSDVGPVNTGQDTSQQSGGYGVGAYGYGGGYGGGGGGGNDGPTEQQVHMAKILQPIARFGQDTLLDKAKHAGDVYSINDQAAENSRLFQSRNAEREAGAEWFSRLLKLQSVAGANREKMGNMAYGSGIHDYLKDLSRVKDADAVEVLEALESNLADTDKEYFDAIQQSINGWNEFAMDTEAKLREGASDYITQLANIHPDLATGDYKGTAENNDEGEEWPQVVDIENKKLNVPDWLTTEYYEKNKKLAQPYDRMDFIRPVQATQKAWKERFNKGQTSTAQAANQRYWDTLTRDYGNRVV